MREKGKNTLNLLFINPYSTLSGKILVSKCSVKKKKKNALCSTYKYVKSENNFPWHLKNWRDKINYRKPKWNLEERRTYNQTYTTEKSHIYY